ncbi:phage tail protein [Aeromonas caviae]|uniref:phage tail protein n=1 Tax=Aeromonas caviae TaxID=648 RepID=UPI002449C15A|nr:phage tail protein [Aeromonas caviae]MDH1634709.1 tail fiber protein [Aeromonas caviae]
MANVPETPSFDAGIYQIETTDPVLGGPNGIANAQAKGLANRTAFLKQQIDQLNSGQLKPSWIASTDYVQGELQKLDAKQSVRAATVANITLSGAQTIDGVTLTVGDRVLVKDQTTAAQNGIYLVAAQSWTRATDADNGTKLSSGARVAVEEGAVNAGKVWYLTAAGAVTVGTTALLFADERPYATPAIAGHVMLASNAEAVAGNVTNKAVTPAGAAEAAFMAYPVGAPIPWPTNVPPAGFLAMIGQAFDVLSYPKLALAYPSGVLPDMRAEFIRGFDNGRGIDSGRAILSSQSDAMRNITGVINLAGVVSIAAASGAFYAGATMDSRTISGTTLASATDDFYFDASRAVPTANENRVRNIAFNYIVRAA